MPRMTHPTLPDQPIHALDEQVPVLEGVGWVVDTDTVEAPDGTVRPADSAAKPAWVEYAVAKGADPEAAESLTVKELIANYGG